MIDIEGLNKKIDLLKSGSVLIMDHKLFGKYEFFMNPQRNRIIVNPINELAKTCHEERVVAKDGSIHPVVNNVSYQAESYLMWGHGEWSVEVKKPTYEVILKDGVYEKL